MFEHTGHVIEDNFFVHQDAARIYRGLKDMLVNEFDIDRIEEGHMEFNVSKPKDRIRMYAFKEKSIHTVIVYNLSFKAASPKSIYKQEREEGILRAHVKIKPTIKSVYPGSEPMKWLPKAIETDPNTRISQPGLAAEERTAWHKSKLYKICAGLWHKKLHAKEIEEYEEEAEESAVRMQNLLREKFGVEETIARTGASQYEAPWK
ncbi:hypothetical protein [Candidatus Nanohalococcus occultus]|uniref:hypothetical protein n=1 Tax=Candidatus Nanohalococcus occultus TaxID=2978047 RepID=UPI00325FD33B